MYPFGFHFERSVQTGDYFFRRFRRRDAFAISRLCLRVLVRSRMERASVLRGSRDTFYCGEFIGVPVF